MVEPAYRWIPEYRETLGPEVADICAMAGFPPDPEQQLALDAIFALRPDGKSALFETAVVVPRQNMKTGLFKQCALGWLFVTKQRLIIWSAHEFATSQEAHRDLKELLESTPQLLKRVKAIPSGNGDEGIELHGGQRIKFRARTKTGGRGLTGDKIVLDEAFALTPGHIGSLMPTLSVVPDAQIVYGSSAGLATSDVLQGIRNRGRAGNDPRLGYLEWCDDLPGDCEMGAGCSHRVGEVTGCRMDDRRRWARANPQLGRRLPLERMESFRKAMPAAEFGREELGWWDEPAGAGRPAIDPDVWVTLKDGTDDRQHPFAIGIATAPDRSWSAIAVGWRRSDGSVHLTLSTGDDGRPDYRPGTTWVRARADELRHRWGTRVLVDTASRDLVPDAEEPGEAEQARAHNALSDAVDARMVWHFNEPAMNTAVRASRWKQGPKTRELVRHGAVDVSPLAAAALVVHALAADGGQPNIW
jgi:hypothetical protein